MASSPTRQHVSLRAVGFRKCLSQKAGFSTYDEALTAAERMMALGKVKPGCHITPYDCPDCGEWHVANRVIVPLSRTEVGLAERNL